MIVWLIRNGKTKEQVQKLTDKQINLRTQNKEQTKAIVITQLSHVLHLFYYLIHPEFNSRISSNLKTDYFKYIYQNPYSMEI
jgi:hypothetical protein